jgi:hypothetical protein
MSISDFSFDDGDRSLTSNTKRLKFKNGETVRISFAWFPKGDDGKYDLKTNPKFRGANRVWVNGVGYVVANSPEIASITGATPKMSIATVVVVWPTDKNGNIDKNRMKNGDCDVMPWVFSKRKYSELKALASEWPFGEHDLKLTCTEAQYQQTSQANCRENFLQKLQEKGSDSFNEIMERVESVVANLNGFIGNEYTVDQLREKMGMAVSSSSTESTTDEVDDMIDSMLD